MREAQLAMERQRGRVRNRHSTIGPMDLRLALECLEQPSVESAAQPRRGALGIQIDGRLDGSHIGGLEAKESTTGVAAHGVPDLHDEEPVWSARFVNRPGSLTSFVVTGSDDGKVRVYSFAEGKHGSGTARSATLTLVKVLAAHHDFVRCVCVHQSRPHLLSCSDDTTIKVSLFQRQRAVSSHGSLKLRMFFNHLSDYIMSLSMCASTHYMHE